MIIKRIIAVSVAVGFLLGISGMQTAQADLTDPEALEERGSIKITSDSGTYDFTNPTYSGVSSGDGTEGNPYIIENWYIDGISISWLDGIGIQIQNTTKYFVIRNVWVCNGGVGYTAVYLSNVTNGVMEDSRVTDNNTFGILLHNATNNTVVQDSRAADNGSAIVLDTDCIENSINNNEIYSASVQAISIQNNSDYNDITDNTVSESLRGILVTGDHNNVSGNFISSIDEMGITVSGAYSDTISDNRVYDCGFDGITAGICSTNVISGNTVRSNAYRGIYLQSDATDNLIYNNYLSRNMQGNAYDAGGNDWNIEKIPGTNIVGGPYLGGNYFSDYVGVDIDGDGLGEIPYWISGGTTIDSLPLCFFREEEALRIKQECEYGKLAGAYNTDDTYLQYSAGVDTYTVVHYDFEVMDWQGWTRHDNTGGHYGMYSGLMTPILADKDPCNDNFGTQVIFFLGSPYPDDEYPGLFETPYCLGSGGILDSCQDEMIISPVIDMTSYSTNEDENQDAPIPPGDLINLGGALLRFTVYRDLPLKNLVFYYWLVRNIVDEWPGQWQDRDFLYYGGKYGGGSNFCCSEKDYLRTTHEIGDLVGDDPIQVAIGIVDMCDAWSGVYGDCWDHTPAPWFDNITIKRFKATGPQWGYRDIDLFQDNFPEAEFDLESYVRADAALDIYPNSNPIIRPGDSVVVSCDSPLGGEIDTTPDGKPMVFMHVAAHYIGDPLSPKPDLYGPSLEGTYGTYYSDDGNWTVIQGEVARNSGGYPVEGRYMFDLNDSLFTRGYAIGYYFKAYDRDGSSSTLPAGADEYVCGCPPAPPRYPYLHPYFEFWCLPTLASDILFVDDFHGRNTSRGMAEEYWGHSFKAVIVPENQPDRYDVNGPSSLVSNGPGGRAKNYHMTTAYNKVIWDCGNLRNATISDGTRNSDKSNDCQMLIDWMNFSEHDVGLWICGDNVAADLAGLPSGISLSLLATWCGVQFVHDSYYELTGTVSPKVTADPNPGNPLWHTTWGDSFYVNGGCPVINAFDVLEKTGSGEYALNYPDYLGIPYHAGIYATGVNNGGYDVRTMWFGFSFMYIRDCDLPYEEVIPPGEPIPIIRNQVVKNIIEWMENPTNSDITRSDEVPFVYNLSQNFPNPFNPITTIKFSLGEKGPVTLKIYNVAGQLVKTLVNEVRDAGSHKVTWDGSNNHDLKVASGIYFYRVNTNNFKKTRKMVLLR